MVRGRDDRGRGRGGNNGGYRNGGNGGNGRNWNSNNGGNSNGNGNIRGNHNGNSNGNYNSNNRGNNKGNHIAGTGNNNRNRIRKGNNKNHNSMSSHRPPWADYVLKLLKDESFDHATFRSLISAAAVMLALVWEQRQRRGMTDTEITRELQLPMYACEQLKNLSQRAIEGTNEGLDAEGDVPMLDRHGQSVSANLVVPELFVWDLFAQNFMNDDQNPPQPTNNN